MSLANTKTLGLAEQFIQFLTDNKTILQENGLDVTNWVTDTGIKKTDALTQIAKQDEIEASSRAQTPVTKASVKTLYNTVSTRIDAAMGVLGKNTPAAKQLGRLRSSLIKQSKPKIENNGK
jgi:hypothetical protein